MENSTIFLSTLLLSAIALFYVHFIKSKKSLYPLPPGPKPWPIVGNLPEMLKNKPTFRWIHELMKEMNTDIACIRFGNVHVVPVTCPEISREFLRKHDALFTSRPISMSTEMTTKGYLSTILVPSGEQWKKMRRVVSTHVVSPAKHRWFRTKRIEEADHLVHYVYEQCKNVSESGGGLVKVRVAAQQYCGNVIRKMVFNKRFFGEGSKDGGPGLEEEEHIDAIFKVLAYIYSFCVSDYVPCLKGVVDLDGHEKVMKENIGIIDKYHDPIIEERILELRDHHGLIKKEVDHEDLLDVLITLKDDDGNPLLSTGEIKAQITELMVATVDNPSNAVEWALAEMINQPKILEKAIEELDRVVGKERLVQESDFSQLNYIKACAREAFRLHPIAPFNVPHVAGSDTTVANYFIPKGSHVLLSRSGLGRNPKAWPDETLKFKPERHLKDDDGSEVVLTENDLRFISFSTGRRGCIGVTLGTSMTVMLFARLLQGFTWTAPPNESKIDLSEAEDSLALAKPLIAVAKPRLAKHVYPAET
ncbi:hypothetical protein LWI28_011960 [Acer negundo]|uniref:Cytochrome P450 n=1 Tax=Acer negundo TaxID=4023 RepID=A0AAD5P566_ACENE|nr:hypothetical protein LWI28_011960 [Acer negundo]KAK4858217.1 hypothetical protein QYF36_012910 [Acer negundo]